MPQDSASDTATIQRPMEPYALSKEKEAQLEGESEEYRAYHLARKERASRVLTDDLTRRIDHILYTEWDPIGVHLLAEYDCFDEYHRYLPAIVDMLREDASLAELSDQLMEVESYMLGPYNIRRRCDVIAVMHGPQQVLVVDAGAHAAGQGHGLQPAQHAKLGVRIAQAVEHHHPDQGLDIDGVTGGAKGPAQAIKAQRIPQFSQRPDIAKVARRRKGDHRQVVAAIEAVFAGPS